MTIMDGVAQVDTLPERERQRLAAKARGVAAEWGHSVAFWIRSGEATEAARRARLAARWGRRALVLGGKCR